MSKDELTTERLLELARKSPIPERMSQWAVVDFYSATPPRSAGWRGPLVYAVIGVASIALVLTGVAVTSGRHNNPRPAATAAINVNTPTSTNASPISTYTPEPTTSGAANTSTHAPTSANVTKATPTAPSSQPQVNCITKPSSCGYPDATNTGVPAGVVLTPASQTNIAGTSWDNTNDILYISGNNVTVSGVSVSGSVMIQGQGDTLKDSKVTLCWTQGAAVTVQSQATNTLIEDSTLDGQDSSNCSESYGVQNETSGMTVQGERLQMDNCTGCWAGTGTLRDSFVDITTNTSSQNAVYYGGGGSGLVLDHNTMINPHSQAQLIFLIDHWGAVTNITIHNNLLAGGSYAIYGGGSTAANVSITQNRFSGLYFPQCGANGVSAGINSSQTTWTGNYWDSNLQSVPPG